MAECTHLGWMGVRPGGSFGAGISPGKRATNAIWGADSPSFVPVASDQSKMGGKRLTAATHMLRTRNDWRAVCPCQRS